LNALAARNFTACRSAPFAIWSVHELNEVFAQNPNGRPSSFSLLHIGGDSCATFDALYRQNGINPAAVAIFKHYNEWTKYSDPDCSLYKLLSYNASNNKGVSMPEHLLTDIRYGDKDTFWPGYRNPQPCRFFFGRNPYIFSLTL
jgi:hypothetical protein